MTNNLIKIEKLFTVNELTSGYAQSWLSTRGEEHSDLYFVISYPDSGGVLVSGYPKQSEFDFTE